MRHFELVVLAEGSKLLPAQRIACMQACVFMRCRWKLGLGPPGNLAPSTMPDTILEAWGVNLGTHSKS